jgi:glycosyltransferase
MAGLFDLQYKLAADYELMLRMFKKYNFKTKYFNRLVVKMRLGGATNQSFTNILNQNKEILKAWKNNGLQAPIYLMPLRLFKRVLQFI